MPMPAETEGQVFRCNITGFESTDRSLFLWTRTGQEYVTKEAFKSHYRKCLHDSKWYRKSRMKWLSHNRRWVGPDGIQRGYFRICCLSEKTFYPTLYVGVRLVDGRSALRDIAVSEGYTRCEGCGNYFLSEDGGEYCPSCQEEIDSEPRSAYGPDSSAYNKKFGRGPIYLGVELEVEFEDEEPCDSTTRSIFKLLGDFIFIKDDGSLNEGFEMSTAPADRAIQEEKWGIFFDNLPTNIECLSTCGIHIHVSRAPLSTTQLGEMLAFIHSPHNKGFVQKIAGRTRDRWCKYIEGKGKNGGDLENNYDRYEAINLTNASTIEFRIFAGTLDRNLFLKNIQFVDAMVNWTANLDPIPANEAYTYEVFTEFVCKNESQWPQLAEFMQKKFPKTWKSSSK